MKNRLLALFLALTLVCGLVLPAMAEEVEETAFAFEEEEMLTFEEEPVLFEIEEEPEPVQYEQEELSVEEELTAWEEEELLPEEAEEIIRIEEELPALFTIEDDVLVACLSDVDFIVVPEGVKVIGEKAFAGLVNLEEIELPDTVEEIQAEAFLGCEKLEKVTAHALKKIGSKAFAGCPALKDTSFADEVEEVAEDAFDPAVPELEQADALPVFNDQPESVTMELGATVTFSATVTGADSYQWQYKAPSQTSWHNVSEGNSVGSFGTKTDIFSFTLTNGSSKNAYRLAASNASGTAYSNEVTATVYTPIVVKKAPVNAYVSAAGESATFTVSASGATSYQWQYKAPTQTSWHNLTEGTCVGVKTNTLTFPVTTGRAKNEYRVVLKNSSETVATEAVRAIITSVPIFTAQPTDQYCPVGETVTFTAEASDAMTWQWQYKAPTQDSWHDLSEGTCTGTTTNTLTFPVTSGRAKNEYRVIASNPLGSAESDAVMVITALPLEITVQPQGKEALLNETVTLSVTANGATGYQWQYKTPTQDSWHNLTWAGAKTAEMTFQITNIRAKNSYRCVVSSSLDSLASEAATFTILTVPTIDVQPVNTTVPEGETVTLTVVSANAESYQWQYKAPSQTSWHNLTEGTCTGTKTNTLSFPATSGRAKNLYRVMLTNAAGSMPSNEVQVSLLKEKPVFTLQPEDQTGEIGAKVTFHAEADYAVSYKWQYSRDQGKTWRDLTESSVWVGTTTDTLTFPVSEYRAANIYRVVATNSVGSTESDSAALLLPQPEGITTQPTDQTAAFGSDVTFTVETATEAAYQWEYEADGGFIAFEGENGASLTLTMDADLPGLTVRCVVTFEDGTEQISDSAKALADMPFTFTAGTDGTTTLTAYTGSATEIVIPTYDNDRNTVTVIGANAFKATGVVTVTLPRFLTLISTSAFENCAQLTTVNYEAETPLTRIGQAAFKNSGLATFRVIVLNHQF